MPTKRNSEGGRKHKDIARNVRGEQIPRAWRLASGYYIINAHKTTHQGRESFAALDAAIARCDKFRDAPQRWWTSSSNGWKIPSLGNSPPSLPPKLSAYRISQCHPRSIYNVFTPTFPSQVRSARAVNCEPLPLCI